MIADYLSSRYTEKCSLFHQKKKHNSARNKIPRMNNQHFDAKITIFNQ